MKKDATLKLNMLNTSKHHSSVMLNAKAMRSPVYPECNAWELRQSVPQLGWLAWKD